MQTGAISVRQLNLYVKSLLEGDARLENVMVAGEISNFKNHYSSGHLYFTLKDKDAAIRCVMFRSFASKIKFMPEDGLQVILRGRVSIYEKDGQFQFYAEEMNSVGIGDISLKFEQIKNMLSREGLFDASNKRPLPKFPRRIAVVTSETGAAVRDIINIASRRWPLCQIVMCHVSVQGVLAVPEMVKTLEQIYTSSIADLIIIGRGGGSIEDLWAFNSEELARKIFESTIPVISAVGHETDFTICDFVADLRAPTPSAAAELALPDKDEIINKINKYNSAMKSSLAGKYNLKKAKLEMLMSSVYFNRPADSIINSRIQTIDTVYDRISNIFRNILKDSDSRLSNAMSKLDSLSPLKTLIRGYSIAEKDDKTFSSVKFFNPGDRFSLRMSDGYLKCIVEEKENIS